MRIVTVCPPQRRRPTACAPSRARGPSQSLGAQRLARPRPNSPLWPAAMRQCRAPPAATGPPTQSLVRSPQQGSKQNPLGGSQQLCGSLSSSLSLLLPLCVYHVGRQHDIDLDQKARAKVKRLKRVSGVSPLIRHDAASAGACRHGRGQCRWRQCFRCGYSTSTLDGAAARARPSCPSAYGFVLRPRSHLSSEAAWGNEARGGCHLCKGTGTGSAYRGSFVSMCRVSMSK
jgi:hypothetical protein